VIATIERSEAVGYWTRMRSLALRLLAMLAVMLMPFGMTAAPAATVHHPEMATAMPMEHCPEPAPRTHSTAGFAHCAMACAAALPAVGTADAPARLLLRSSLPKAAAKMLSGIELEIATPPPRFA